MSTPRRLICGILLAGLISLPACHPSQKSGTALIRINGDSPGRTFDGIGAVSAGASSRLLIDYPEPYRRQILDYLFKPDYGASLQHLKVEIGSDANSTDGSEPSHMRTRNDQNYTRGYEWWLMEEAYKRNPQIVLDSLAWGAPGWIGNGNFYSQDMANYVVNFIRGAGKAHHLDIAYTGIWNETRYQPNYVKLLKLTLQDSGLQTRVVCCDLYPGEDQWSMIGQMQHDPDLRKAIDVVGVHYPHKNGHVTTSKNALNIGKPLWATEDQGGVDNKLIFYPGANKWSLKGRGLAHLYNINYIEGRLTATEVWSPITSYYDILPAPRSGLMTANTPWSGHYELPATLWVTAHTTQFTQPGWKYIDSACGYLAGKGTFVTLRSPNSGDYSVILETVAAKSPQKVSFQVTGGLSTGAVHVWETNGTKTFEHVTDITPQQGSFSLTLDPDSIYTVSTT
ncbi:MAG TPA: galactosylceramidase, partial [Terriglobia bacterium]|nr:galactosylceramidase [Terriglobia bacterium]